jgi:hypothetical protein
MGARFSVIFATVAALTAARPALAQPSASPATVHLHIESNRPVVLLREVDAPIAEKVEEQRGSVDAPSEGTPSRREWSLVCESPCDQEVPLAGTYRLDGKGIRATRKFNLEGHPGERMVITVDPTSNSTFVTGIVVGSVGVAAMGVGVLFLSAAFMDSAVGNQNSATDDVRGGLACGVGGAAVAAVGTFILLENLHSKVGVARDGITRPVISPNPTTPVAGRAATWREIGLPAAPPKAMVVPLWRGTF